MTRFSWVTVIVAVIFVLLIVVGFVNWREDMEDQANPTPSPTGTLPLTIIAAPSSTPTRTLPVTVTPERLPGLAGASTPTPIPPLVLPTEETTVTMTLTPSPSAAVQKGLAP